MDEEIVICKKCDGIRISKYKKLNNYSYKCIDCGGTSTENTKKTRPSNITDYKIYNKNSSISEKVELYNFLFKDLPSKNKFLNGKNVDENLKKWLNINHIIIKDIEINVENIFNYCKNFTETDKKCKNPLCGKNTQWIGIHERHPNGRYTYCCDECMNKHRSIRQMGENNTSHKMTDDTREKTHKKLSIIMKDKIKSGEFTPCVTNSWCHSMYEIKINNELKKVRSSWEALYWIVNPLLKYEKIRIPYIYKNIEYIYVVDFLDDVNNILYEIKPNSEKTKGKNEAKQKYAIKWCKNNGYKYFYIDDTWFINNYEKYKHLLEEQPYNEKLMKNLIKFKNEN